MRNAGWSLRWSKSSTGSPHSLVTKISQISNQIHKSGGIGGGNTVKMNSKVFDIFKKIEYFHSDIMKLCGRYDVIIDDLIEDDILYVYYDNFPLEGIEVPVDSDYGNYLSYKSVKTDKMFIIIESSPHIDKLLANGSANIMIITKNILLGTIAIDN